MKTILCEASAGSGNKSDALVTVAPADSLQISLTAKPIIMRQYGGLIDEAVRQAAEEEGVDAAVISVTDGGGALDYVIRARVRCALRRAKGGAAA